MAKKTAETKTRTSLKQRFEAYKTLDKSVNWQVLGGQFARSVVIDDEGKGGLKARLTITFEQD